jgi:hypothetical protein
MVNFDWVSILEAIPANAEEPIVSEKFVKPLMESLGFSGEEWRPEFQTGSGSVDFATRKNSGDDDFLISKENPYLLIEVKGQAITSNTGTISKINLTEGSPQYKSTKEQIEEADRKSWKDLTPIIKLACGITKGKKLDILSEIFYLDPPEAEVLPDRPIAVNIKKASYDEILERLSYLSTYKIDGFDKVDVVRASDAIFTASKGRWRSLNPITKLECGIDRAKVKILKSVFTL